MNNFPASNLSIAEKCQKIKEKLKNCGHYYSPAIFYNSLDCYLTDDVIKYISYHGQGKVKLHFIARVMNRQDRCSLYEKVYALRNEISPRELMLMYLDAMNDKNDIFENIRMLEQPAIPLKESQTKAWGATKPLKGRRICIASVIENAIITDSPAGFIMYSDMTGQKMSSSLLNIILDKQAVEVLAHLIQHDLIPAKISDRDTLVTNIVCTMPGCKAVKFLKAIDKAMPGYVKNFTDGYGRNLLWYAIYNNRFWNHPDDELVQYLLSAGCSPENKNALGISWRYFKMFAPVIAKQQPTYLHHINMLTEKNIFYYIRQFQDCSVQSGHIGLPKIIRFSRSRSSAPLLEESAKLLKTQLRETFWNFEFAPEATLPVSWQKNLFWGTQRTTLPGKLRIIAKNVMKSCQHPYAHKPAVFTNCYLQNIPVIEANERIRSDHGFNKAVQIMKTGLLMYNPLVTGYLLDQHYALCKSLRYIYMRANKKLISPDLKKAIEQDDVKKFAELNNNNEIYKFEVIDAVMRGAKLNIITSLLDDNVKFIDSYPPQELVLYAASQLDDAAGIVLLNALEQRWPKIIKESLDCFGSNALYHAIFNKNIRWYEPDCPLVKFMKKSGCRIQAVNKFGIAPMDVLQVLNKFDIAWRSDFLKAV